MCTDVETHFILAPSLSLSLVTGIVFDDDDDGGGGRSK